MAFETKFIWLNGKFIPFQKAKIHLMTHALHYGTSVFEGIRCYQTKRGPALFRLKEHVDRFFFGIETLRMPMTFLHKEICDVALALIRKNNLTDCYVRPLAYYGYGNVGVNPKGREINIAIMAIPFKDYLPPKPIAVKVSPLRRIHCDATVRGAKIGGMYYNAALSSMWAHENGADEALMLDTKGFVAEGASSNICGIKKVSGKPVLFTPKSPDILEGITKKTVIQIAKDCEIPTITRPFIVTEFIRMEEAFFTGTAIEIHPIGSIDGHRIGKGVFGKITQKIKTVYQTIVHGEMKQYRSMLTYVPLLLS